MMVCHDHGQSGLLCPPDRFRCSNTVIAGDDHLHACLHRLPDHPLVETISVPHPVRQDKIDPRSRTAQTPGENIGGTDAIHIIIAYDADPFSGVCGAAKQLCGLPDAGQIKGTAEIFYGPSQIPPGFLCADDAPVPNDSRKDRRDTANPSDLCKISTSAHLKPFCHDISAFHPAPRTR